MKFFANSLWFKFISALAVCLLAAIVSNYLTPQKGDAYSSEPGLSYEQGRTSKEVGKTTQTLLDLIFNIGKPEIPESSYPLPSLVPQTNSSIPEIQTTPLIATATKASTSGSVVEGHDDGVMFYFPTDDGVIATPTESWQVIYHTPLPTITLAPTLTPKSTNTPKPTSTPKVTKTVTNTATPTQTSTPTPSPAPSLSPTTSPTLTLIITSTLQATATSTLQEPVFSPTPLLTATTEPYAGSFAYVNGPDQEGQYDIVLYNTIDKKSKILAHFDEVELCNWTQDGSNLLIRTRRVGKDVFDLGLLSISGDQNILTSSLPGSSGCGDWLSDTQLIFPYIDENGNSILVEYDLETDLLKTIYQSDETFTDLDLSPDGQWAVFISAVGDRNKVVLFDLVNVQGTILSSNDMDEESPRFSPDGQTIFFSRSENSDWTVVAYDRQSATETDLGKGRWPDLSKDGMALLFSALDSGVEKLYLSLIGQPQRFQLVSGGDSQTNPLWCP